jgi:hypothetical protein
MPGRAILLATFMFLSNHFSYGEAIDSAAVPPLRAVRLTEPIEIDGVLSESLYQRPGFIKFTQREPSENAVPTQLTEIWIGYDDKALYIGARMEDSAPDSIEQRLARKDAGILADAFTFYVDGYHDKQSGYYFGLNAAGTMYDGILYNDDDNDDSWDGIWEGKTHVDAHGWNAEMRIPYSQIRFTTGDGFRWAINCKRVIARRNENDYIVFTPRNGSGFVSRFPPLTGIENINPPARIEFLPYLTGKAEYAPHDPGDPFHTGSKFTPGAGADFKLGLSSNLTVDGAINPDFGQVEVDPAVVNLSDVETYFNEKRPFFLEGANIFNFGRGGTSNNWNFNWGDPTYFYSRRIGRAPQGSVSGAHFIDIPTGTHILGAAKLSGKTGENWSLGAISALTRREMADVDSAGVQSTREVEPLTSYNVLRLSREINDGRQGIGVISTFTQRNFQDDRLRDQINNNALTGGIDGWTAFDGDKTWVMRFWGGLSHVTGTSTRILSLQEGPQHYFQRPDAGYIQIDSAATALDGYAGRMFVTKQKGNFTVNGAIGVISPGFDLNDLGFQGHTDLINMHVGNMYYWTTPTSWYRNLQISAAAFRTVDFGGDITWEGLWQNADILFPNYIEFGWAYAYNPSAISDRRTRGGPKTVTPPGYEITAWLNGDSRNSFIPGFNFDSYQAFYQRTYSFFWSLDWKPVSNVEVILSPELDKDWEYSQWVGAVSDPTATATYGKRYLFGEMNQTSFSAGVRVNWAFTPRLSLQAYVQPLLSVGTFTNFKELARPRSYDFNNYGTGGSTIVRDSLFRVDPDGAGPAGTFTFSNPDFNYKSLRGDIVLRWEFAPGSTIYLVWTQSRFNSENAGDYQFSRDVKNIFSSQPDNIFLMKIAYWITP